MYTNAQVASLVTALDARIARIEAAIVASPAQPSAATSERPAAEALATPGAKVKVGCTLHADKRFALTPAGAASGSGFHFGWCKGEQVA